MMLQILLWGAFLVTVKQFHYKLKLIVNYETTMNEKTDEKLSNSDHVITRHNEPGGWSPSLNHYKLIPS